MVKGRKKLVRRAGEFERRMRAGRRAGVWLDSHFNELTPIRSVAGLRAGEARATGSVFLAPGFALLIWLAAARVSVLLVACRGISPDLGLGRGVPRPHFGELAPESTQPINEAVRLGTVVAEFVRDGGAKSSAYREPFRLLPADPLCPGRAAGSLGDPGGEQGTVGRFVYKHAREEHRCDCRIVVEEAPQVDRTRSAGTKVPCG